jgi:hypothetical protein
MLLNSSKCLTATLTIILTLHASLAHSQEVSASSDNGSISMRSEKGVQRWKHVSGFSDFNIEMRGRIEVTDDDRDIKSMSNDGYLEITKTVFGSKRAIIIESHGGSLTREYREGRSKMDWNPHGKNWLAEILPDIVRSTTLAAEGRVNRIFGKEGASGVVAEITRLKGDYTQAHYAKLLFNKNIPSSELGMVITGIANSISSDYYLSTVFQNNITKMLSTPPAAEAFFQGTKKINSDYYKAVVLKEALKKFPASPTQVKTILQSAASIDSDYYLSVVLTTLLEQDNVQEESLNELIVISKNIPSDYYRTQVLRSALEKEGISKTTLLKILGALAEVNSDYYKSTVVNSMAENSQMDSEVQVQVIAMIGTSVNSDYYAAGSLKNIIEHQKLSDQAFKELASVTGKIGSANYSCEVIKSAARKDLTKNQLMEMLQASAEINSDYYLSEALSSLADKVRSADSGVKDAYRKAAKNIHSDTYYGKAVKAID